MATGEFRKFVALRNGEVRVSEARASELEQKNKQRYHYAGQFVSISMWSLAFVSVMIALSGVNLFSLSDTVNMALLGTALSTVFAPAYLLARYLFPKHRGDPD